MGAVDEVADPNPVAPVVLFFTDNGHGLGHITRLMAVAQEAQGRFIPVFLTMSEAFPLVRQFGYGVEYLPSDKKLGVGRNDWQHLFAQRLVAVVRRTGARVVVIDHIGPPEALLAVRQVTSGVDFVWSRRGLWRPENKADRRLALSQMFDAVVEPGDVAGPIDLGATALRRAGVESIPPVLLVPPAAMVSRAEARRVLGIPEDGRAVLVQLSDSDSGKLATLIDRARLVILRAAGEQVHVVAPVHVLHGDALPHVEGVHMVPVYPMAKFLRAFDGVVSTAGYNSFHEVMASGLPAVIVARDTGSLDDQVRRAEFAELAGRAFWALNVHDDTFERAVRKMLAPGEGRIAAAVTEELGPMDGAARFADLVAMLARERTDQVDIVGEPSVNDRALRVVQQKVAVNGGSSSRSKPNRVLVSAIRHRTDELLDLAEQLASAPRGRVRISPVFLVSDVDPYGLSKRGYRFETVMTDEEWQRLGPSISYAEYVEERVSEAAWLYGCRTVIEADPGVPLAVTAYA